MTCARSVAMDNSEGIVLLCVFYIAIVDAQDSFDDGGYQRDQEIIGRLLNLIPRLSGDYIGLQEIDKIITMLSGDSPDDQIHDEGDSPDDEIHDEGDSRDYQIHDEGDYPDYQIPDEGDHQRVMDLLHFSADCDCTTNGTFVTDGFLAGSYENRIAQDHLVQIECATINLNSSEYMRSANERRNLFTNYPSTYPISYHLNCHRKYFKHLPCWNLYSLLGLQYLSLNGCSLRFLYCGWSHLEVLEVMDDFGISDELYTSTSCREKVLLVKLFRWCPGKSNPLLTEEEIFPPMPVLQFFTAQRCGLTRFPFGGGFIRTLKRSSQLELINLSHNGIQFLEVFNTSQLKSPHLTLDFSHNEIKNVTSAQLELLVGRESIYVNLSHNSIRDIDILNSYVFTKSNVTIDLSHNKITTISQADVKHLINAKSTFVNLQNNQLDCDCRMSFLWEISLLGNYMYLLSEKCASPKQFAGKYLKQLTLSDICQNNNGSKNGSNPKYIYLKLETAIMLMTLVLVITVIISFLMFKYRTEMRVVIYTKCGLVLPCESRDYEDNKRYDAFVAYSGCDEDLTWVIGTLFPMLTEDGNDFKICLHHKDFIPGKSIAENIADAIEWSRFTILVLSRNFLRSEWCIYEFRSAFDQSLQERKQHMIFILMEEIIDDQMDSDLRKCLRFYTYIKADDVLLRDRMTYALSDKRRGKRDRARRGARRRMLGVQPRVDEGQAAAANVIEEAETVL